MNREILFKAKRIDNGEWMEGYIFSPRKGIRSILTRNFSKYEVIPETICQYTGLTDKDGNKIWENDIVGYLDTYSTDNGYAEADCIGQVVWDSETLSFQVTNRMSAESYEVLDECAVIGNIFDNLEILEGGAEE